MSEPQEVFFDVIEQCIRDECGEDIGKYITTCEIQDLARNMFQMVKEWKEKI